MSSIPRTPRDPADRFLPLMRNAIRLRCPACKRARIFPRIMRMEDRCPACGLVLKREPGYFLGSIYFNYGATVALAGVVYFGMLFGLDLPPSAALAAALAVVLTFPFWFWRYARSLWLMFDQYFDPRRAPDAAPGPAVPTTESRR